MSKVAGKAEVTPIIPHQDGRPVSTAFLQAAIYLVGTTETTLNKQRLPGIQMVWIEREGLLVDYKGQTCLVPATNVKVAFLEK